MSVRDFRELVCWQLSYELKCEVLAFIESGPASKDFKYRDQIKDSSLDGWDRAYLANPLYSRLQNLARAALKATTNLMLAKKRHAERLKRLRPRR